jgi:hypothetical protein
MTYVKQLEMYEDAVIQKRMEEMTEAEVRAHLSLTWRLRFHLPPAARLRAPPCHAILA